ncbi:hypothetical protein PZE06_11440 [Robertmurraya sp. DFI.2.37]|uniref:hypothetical protein n=1 Tax=Robertmurraya sp. DFI.2.37 TaxID=3031819 RepID=UPI001247D247|nr:hypothetical protein [Robertmurraya sp. DFI.2.37]MDF1508787.1 hypothetical protein [Robertmurraya sp. DFI.2.37]
MKREINIWMLLIVIVAGVIIGVNANNPSKISSTTSDTLENKNYEKLNSDNQHVQQEEAIKKALDMYMSENFYRYHKTTWFDSVSGTDAVINEYGKTFIIQSKGKEYEQEAEKFYSAVLGFFNAKTTDPKYLVDNVILIDQDFNILRETKTIH